MTLAKLTWTTAKPSDVENFVAYLAKGTVGALFLTPAQLRKKYQVFKYQSATILKSLKT